MNRPGNKLSLQQTKPNNFLKKLLLINCRSLYQNFYSIENYINSFDKKPDFIILTETWLKNDEIVKLDGYNFNGRERKRKKGGGIGVFSKTNIKIVVQKVASNIELICLKILELDLQIIVVYNPPNKNKNEFLVELEN